MTSSPKIYFLLYIFLIAELLLVIQDRDIAEDNLVKFFKGDSTKYILSFVDDIKEIKLPSNINSSSQLELITKGFVNESEKVNVDLSVVINKDTTNVLKPNREVFIDGIKFKLKQISSSNPNYLLICNPVKDIFNKTIICESKFKLANSSLKTVNGVKYRKYIYDLPENIKRYVMASSQKFLNQIESEKYVITINFLGTERSTLDR